MSTAINIPIPQYNPEYRQFSLIAKAAQPIDPGFTITGFENIVVQGGYAYAIGGGNPGFTLCIYDVRDSFNPKALGYLTTGSVPWMGGTPYYLNGSYSMAINGNYLYVASSGSSYFYVVNISNPFAPFNVSKLLITNTPGSLYGIAYQNGYCYIATQSTGLVVVDVGGPTGIGAGGGTITAPVQTFQEGGAVKSFGVAANGNTIYTTQYVTTSPYATRQIKSWTITGSGTSIHPILLQSLQVTGVGEALGISVFNNPTDVPATTTAFVSTQAAGAYITNIIDITNPSAMTNISQIVSSNVFNSAFVAQQGDGHILYVPSGKNAVYGGAIDAYSIINRSSPIHLSQVTSGVANSVFGGIAINNDYIYCADYGPTSTQGNLDIFSTINTRLIGVG